MDLYYDVYGKDANWFYWMETITRLHKDYYFPFNDMEGDDLGEIGSPNYVSSISHAHYENFNLETFDLKEHKLYYMENNIDPDKYFYNNINRTCEYYTDEQFKSKIIMDGTLSIIHFNSRSLHSNFFKIKDYLKFCSMFSVIAVSETLLTTEKEADVELQGYKLFSTKVVLHYLWTIDLGVKK